MITLRNAGRMPRIGLPGQSGIPAPCDLAHRAGAIPRLSPGFPFLTRKMFPIGVIFRTCGATGLSRLMQIKAATDGHSLEPLPYRCADYSYSRN